MRLASCIWRKSPSAACGEIRSFLARPAAVITGARSNRRESGRQLRAGCQRRERNALVGHSLQAVEIAERRYGGGGDAFQKPRHPGDTDAGAEAIELGFRRQPEGQRYGAAEAAGAPAAGGEKDSVEQRKRLFHRSTVHPGAGAETGPDQGRFSLSKTAVGQPFGDFGVAGGLAGANWASNSRIAAASAMGRQLRISASRRQYRAMLRA